MAVKVSDGNRAAAYAALLARPDVVAVYPITPQTPIGEQLANFKTSGLLQADVVEVEGENSAMAVVTGAAVAGGRVFTATSSWGLAFMHDGLIWCAGMRVPVVMVNVNREAPFMRGIHRGRSDILGIRDAGWVQIEVETCQEIVDTILMAFRLAEDPDILLPVVVSFDGYYLSHQSEPYDLPSQEKVDTFLAPRDRGRLTLQPGSNLDFGTTMPIELFAEYRYKHSLALERVKEKLPLVEREFANLFGRSCGGMVESYRAEDADVLLITAGTFAGTCRVVVDLARNAGQKVGLLKIRMFRPFPRNEVKAFLEGKKAVGVIDCTICMGWHCGHLFMELKAVLADVAQPPKTLLNFIDGMASLDLTVEHVQQALELTQGALAGEAIPEVNWLMFPDWIESLENGHGKAERIG